MVMFRQDLHIYPAWDEKTVRAEADNFQTVHADSISSHASQETFESNRDISPITNHSLALKRFLLQSVFLLSDWFYFGIVIDFIKKHEQNLGILGTN